MSACRTTQKHVCDYRDISLMIYYNVHYTPMHTLLVKDEI